MDQPTNRLQLRDFPGRVSNADATDIPPGAGTEQRNLKSGTEGMLEVRQGYRKVTFDN